METILVSKCLLGVKCTYEGQGHKHPGLLSLGLKLNLLAVCPEMEAGLGCPREGVTVREGKAIGKDTGTNYTAEYLVGARAVLELCQKNEIERAYLLENSPSCGRGYGLTAKLLAEHGIEIVQIQRPHQQQSFLVE